MTNKQIAQASGVSVRQLQQARFVAERGDPLLPKMVESGDLPLHLAIEIAALPPDRQAQICRLSVGMIKVLASEIIAERRDHRWQSAVAQVVRKFAHGREAEMRDYLLSLASECEGQG